MSSKDSLIGTVCQSQGQAHFFPVQLAVNGPLQRFGYEHLVIDWIDGDLSHIKERVDIASKQNSILNVVCRIPSVGTDMCRLQSVLAIAVSNYAAPTVGC